MSMMNPRSRITGEVSTSWPLLNNVGVRMTIACDWLSFIPSALSQNHVFVSFTQASIRARAYVWSVSGKMM